jgi:hypothetical protein
MRIGAVSCGVSLAASDFDAGDRQDVKTTAFCDRDNIGLGSKTQFGPPLGIPFLSRLVWYLKFHVHRYPGAVLDRLEADSDGCERWQRLVRTEMASKSGLLAGPASGCLLALFNACSRLSF